MKKVLLLTMASIVFSVVALLDTAYAAAEECKTCFATYDVEDCDFVDFGGGPEWACKQTIRRGEPCDAPSEDPCWLCSSFPQYHERCEQVTEFSSSTYLPSPNWWLICPTFELTVCPDDPELNSLIDDAINQVNSEDSYGLFDVLKRSKGKVYINAERRSIQAVGCGQQVVLDIQLSDKLLESLTLLSERDQERQKPAIPGPVLLMSAGIVAASAIRRRLRN